MPGIEFAIEGIVEEHSPHVEQRQRQHQHGQLRAGKAAACKHHAHEHVAPHRGQVGNAAELQCQAQVQAPSSLRTHWSSRATASSTVPLRNASGSTPQV